MTRDASVIDFLSMAKPHHLWVLKDARSPCERDILYSAATFMAKRSSADE